MGTSATGSTWGYFKVCCSRLHYLAPPVLPPLPGLVGLEGLELTRLLAGRASPSSSRCLVAVARL